MCVLAVYLYRRNTCWWRLLGGSGCWGGCFWPCQGNHIISIERTEKLDLIEIDMVVRGGPLSFPPCHGGSKPASHIVRQWQGAISNGLAAGRDYHCETTSETCQPKRLGNRGVLRSQVFVICRLSNLWTLRTFFHFGPELVISQDQSCFTSWSDKDHRLKQFDQQIHCYPDLPTKGQKSN